jgi:hypothetical protein
MTHKLIIISLFHHRFFSLISDHQMSSLQRNFPEIRKKRTRNRTFHPQFALTFYISFLFRLNFRPSPLVGSTPSSSPQTTLLFFTPALLLTNSSTSAILQHKETAAKAFALAVRWTPSLHTTSFTHNSSTPGSLSHPSRSYQ